MAADFEHGFARRLMLAAPNRLGDPGGLPAGGARRALFVGVLLFAVALIGGMQVDGGAVDLFGLLVLALLVNATAALWASGVAMRLRSIQAGPVMQMPVFLILFIAPVYVPLGLLAAGSRRSPRSTRSPRWSRPAATSSRAHPRPAAGLRGRGGARALFGVWAVRGLRKAEAAG